MCRNFFFTIERNILSLDRPKINYLDIFNDGYRISRVEYSIEGTEYTGRGNYRFGNCIPKVVEFSNDDEYECFLKLMDFTEIRKIKLENVLNGESVSSKYTGWPT
uniref:Protein kinase domain-containing protein n=1 Tax=Strongyloides papillosus TaxID=174720 RepID=A0A0N5BQW0_STREA